MTDEDWNVLWREVTEEFSPGAPIEERDLFAGRIDQLRKLVDIVHQRGRHAIVYGERGVGKTSLANILRLVTDRPTSVVAVRVNSSPDDSFTSLWKKVFKRITYRIATENGDTERRLADDLPDYLTPDDIQLELGTFSSAQVPIVILDEFDRIEDKSAKKLVADTIKALSDYSVNATVIVVGVAEHVTTLIEGHDSISRCLVQVKMQRMSQDELGEIVAKRYSRFGMTIDDDVLWKLTFLSRGLPYYTHLLGMHSARAAIGRNSLMVDSDDLENALGVSITEVDQSIREKYYAATVSQRPTETLYEPVLLACALANCDELGRFQQMAVAEPLNRIVPGKNYSPTTFAFHMNAMCTPERRCVLERLGEARNYRYRFTDPTMQPFVILKGLRDKRITDEIAQVFASQRQLKLSSDF